MSMWISSCKIPHKMVLLTWCPCGFRFFQLAPNLHPALGTSYVCSYMLSYVCFPLCALTCVLSYLWCHICARTCLLSFVCSYMCSPLYSHMCALICVLSHWCSNTFALTYLGTCWKSFCVTGTIFLWCCQKFYDLFRGRRSTSDVSKIQKFVAGPGFQTYRIMYLSEITLAQLCEVVPKYKLHDRRGIFWHLLKMGQNSQYRWGKLQKASHAKIPLNVCSFAISMGGNSKPGSFDLDKYIFLRPWLISGFAIFRGEIANA